MLSWSAGSYLVRIRICQTIRERWAALKNVSRSLTMYLQENVARHLGSFFLPPVFSVHDEPGREEVGLGRNEGVVVVEGSRQALEEALFGVVALLLRISKSNSSLKDI